MEVKVNNYAIWAVYLKGSEYNSRAICSINDLSDYDKLRMWLVDEYELAFPKLEKAIAAYDDFVRFRNKDGIKLELVKIEVL